jgi:hypothetical protein
MVGRGRRRNRAVDAGLATEFVLHGENSTRQNNVSRATPKFKSAVVVDVCAGKKRGVISHGWDAALAQFWITFRKTLASVSPVAIQRYSFLAMRLCIWLV